MKIERSDIKEVYLIFPSNRECRVEVLTPAGEYREIASYNLTEDSEELILIEPVLHLKITLQENCPRIRKVARAVPVKLVNKQERGLLVVVNERIDLLQTDRPRDIVRW